MALVRDGIISGLSKEEEEGEGEEGEGGHFKTLKIKLQSKRLNPEWQHCSGVRESALFHTIPRM